jgi:hypothetical protein
MKKLRRLRVGKENYDAIMLMVRLTSTGRVAPHGSATWGPYLVGSAELFVI